MAGEGCFDCNRGDVQLVLLPWPCVALPKFTQKKGIQMQENGFFSLSCICLCCSRLYMVIIDHDDDFPNAIHGNQQKIIFIQCKSKKATSHVINSLFITKTMKPLSL